MREMKIKKQKLPRQYSLVKHVASYGPKGETKPFSKKQILIYLGEIPNMPGHCIVADHKTGRLYSGYHTERFIEIPEDET